MNSFRDILKEYWGYDSFRPLQEDIIASIYSGKDTLGLMPTGGGKSLTFQVPTLLMEGLCIVVTPLIALMKDQVDNLKKRGIKAAYLHSGMSRQEMIVALENCIFGNYKFLYVAPERLSSELFLHKLRDMKVCLIAVDESHCISQWGYDFRPSYMKIADLRERLPEVPVLALTATATPDVIDDIQNRLKFREKNVFRKSFERPNISYIIRRTEEKLYEIVHIIKKINACSIVYVRSRKLTKEIALELQRQGIKADFFHAGLNPDEKINKQNAWKNDECPVIVCTNAFGMGIDKPDVRLVIHYELPGSLEEYFQEAGRAGRDEQKAYAVALCSSRDNGQLKKRISDEFPGRDFLKDVYEKLAYYFQIPVGEGKNTGHNFHIEEFCRTYKYNITQVHHALKTLSLSAYIEYIEDTDRQSKLIFTIGRDELYKFKTFNEPTENLIRVLLRSYSGLFVDYVYISERLLGTRTGMEPLEVYETLKYLSKQQIIHYIPPQKVPVIYYSQNREELKYLSIPQMVYEDRKERLEYRTKYVVEYGTSTTQCRSKLLLAYFGEKDAADCGHCDVCLEKKRNQNPSDIEQITKEITLLLGVMSARIPYLIAQFDYPGKDILTAIRFMIDSKKIKRLGEWITLR
ncbi:RecQ family ATP-dependent DNA helicase [Bacteroidales bacterium OttesenSCG-928-A17]|nr:RecQ family ATP-dependent DNA helicase [Bacteroidales bacterium OttesenSCG-928-A17]